jgi:thiamine-phosphate pyrophosphorylase
LCTSGKGRGISFPAKRPLYYFITDRHQLPAGTVSGLKSAIARAVGWGVDFIQLREKDLPDRELLRLTQNAVKLSRGTGCRILVNGRLDIAIAGGANGVHLPSAGLEASDLISCIPPDFILGVSTHSLREARRAAAAGADYIVLGPVFPTPSKLQYGKPMGCSRFRQICSAVPLPVFGLGGIRLDNIQQVLNAGAAGVAGITLFQQDLRRLRQEPRP